MLMTYVKDNDFLPANVDFVILTEEIDGITYEWHGYCKPGTKETSEGWAIMRIDSKLPASPGGITDKQRGRWANGKEIDGIRPGNGIKLSNRKTYTYEEN